MRKEAIVHQICVFLQERKRKVKLEELGSLDLLSFRKKKLFEVTFRAYSRVFLDMVKSRVSSCLVCLVFGV